MAKCEALVDKYYDPKVKRYRKHATPQPCGEAAQRYQTRAAANTAEHLAPGSIVVVVALCHYHCNAARATGKEMRIIP